MDKKCTKCKRMLDLDTCFYQRKDGRRFACKECENKNMKAYYHSPKGLASMKRTWAKLRENKLNLVLLWQCKGSAKKLGRECSITAEDIVIPKTCPVLGIPLFYTKGARTDNTPSVDRIDNTKGYVKGNVHVVSWRANKIKQNASLEELKAWVSFLERRGSCKESSLTAAPAS